MEFAITVPDYFSGADDSWLPGGARSFLFVRAFFGNALYALDRRELENFFDRGIWSYRHAGALWVARIGADSHWRSVSIRDFGSEFDGVFFPGTDRAIHFESHGDLAGLAGGHCGGVLRGVHDIFQFWMGDGQNDGSWRVGAGFGICRGQRVRRVVFIGGGNTASQQILIG